MIFIRSYAKLLYSIKNISFIRQIFVRSFVQLLYPIITLENCASQEDPTIMKSTLRFSHLIIPKTVIPNEIL